jgi:beta-glucosidase
MRRISLLLPAALWAAVWMTGAPAPKALSSFGPQVKAVLARMTLDEKIGQMTQAEQDALKDQADIENLFLGSLLSGGNSDPKEGNSSDCPC